MNITQADFERLLPAAVSYAAYQAHDGVYGHAAAGRAWQVRLGPEEERRIALIRLPMRRVEIELSGYGDDEAAAWLARFDLYFQKGGG